MRSFTLLATIIFFSPLTSFAQFSLSGNVSTQYNARTISGAKVELINTSQVTFTNEEGFFSFPSLVEGNYRLHISYSGYSLYEKLVSLDQNTSLQIEMIPEIPVAGEVLISATRASKRTATTFEELNIEEIQERNFARDIPFLLEQTPSVVTTSDAGAGVGYTGIRIRGSDPTRINVTINGIPLNDSESHGTFWVNLPDFASSTNNIQIQRGVGTSTNGAAAFGASINLQTDLPSQNAFATSDNAYGSFNTWRNTVQFGTGLIDERFSFDLRLSRINSDGWVDRASSNLKSFFIGANYFSKKSLLKINVFSGRERTYQSWFGVPEALAKGDEQGLEDHIARNFYTPEQIENLRNSGRQYNFYTYDDQVDNYQQNHYQLHYSIAPINKLDLSIGLHYTQGEGFFEEFREGDPLSAYGLNPIIIGTDSINSTNLVRRRWLDNDFYGLVFTTRYQANEKLELLWGGGINRYDGDHFGEVIWAEFASSSQPGDRYYESRSVKYDGHSYVKAFYDFSDKLSAYGDIQLRHIDYQFGNETLDGPGTENEGRFIQGAANYTFVNPKIGLTYQLNERSYTYTSFSVAHREPIRNDFIENVEIPREERLNNLELGYKLNLASMNFGATFYWMQYRDQLVLTGQLNDVGAFVRTNVPESYRAGLEVQGNWKPYTWLQISGNLTYSRNRIDEFTEVITSFDEETPMEKVFRDTDISFSPSWVSAYTISFFPIPKMEVSVLGKYVGEQFLDNTSNASRIIEAYHVSDLRMEYEWKPSWIKAIRLGLFVNNIFDVIYEANGYTFSFIAGGETLTENFLYPQAGINASGRVLLSF